MFLLPIGIFLTSCYTSPKPVYQLKPMAEESRWYLGQEFVKSDAENIEIAVAFERTVGSYWIFDVEIANLSDQAVLVAPEKFYIKPMQGRSDTIISAGKYIYAINPEQKLLEIDKHIAREEAHYASAMGTDATISILDLFSDIATIGKEKTPEEIEQEEHEDAEREASRTDTEIRHENSMNQLVDMRGNWENLTLRKTTLFPGYFIDGKVYFPAKRNVNYLELSFPVENTLSTFVFQVVEI
jgi:hypothetical protein